MHARTLSYTRNLRYARAFAPSLLSPLLDIERNATAVAAALSTAVVALNDCARTKRDADAAFTTACGPFLGGLATLVALQWAALLAVVAARPCWNAVRFARWHDARVRSAVRERAALRRRGPSRSDIVASDTARRTTQAAISSVPELRGAQVRSIDDTMPVLSSALIDANARAASSSASAVSALAPSNLYSYGGRGSVYSPSPSSSSPSSGVFGSSVGSPVPRSLAHAHVLAAANQSPLLVAADTARGVRDDGVYHSASMRSSPPALSGAPAALRDRRGQ